MAQATGTLPSHVEVTPTQAAYLTGPETAEYGNCQRRSVVVLHRIKVGQTTSALNASAAPLARGLPAQTIRQGSAGEETRIPDFGA